MKVYVASSWKNSSQPKVVEALRGAGHEVYDFRNPSEGDHGFHWSEIDPDWENWTVKDYLKGIVHPVAESGFRKDFEAMKWADTCVLVLPSGTSSHLEAGYFVGAGKPLLILLDNPFFLSMKPELMYKMATQICGTIKEILETLEPRKP
jgi:hypothetical protein